MTMPISPESILAFVTGVAGSAIAFSVYRLSRVQRDDGWLRSLWEFHQAFWKDKDMERVRAWIASDAAYAEVRPILVKRNMEFKRGVNYVDELTIEEYKSLELIDRYSALLLAYSRISPRENSIHRQAKERLFDDYWVRSINAQRRPELFEYVNKFFPDLLTAA